MPRRDTAARRYAEAAYEVARSDDALDEWLEDLEAISQTLAIRELRAVVEHPAIAYAEKERVLRRALQGVRPRPLNLLLLLVRRGRPGAVEPMRRHFEDLVRRRRGIVRAEIRSALPLDERERDELRRHLASLAGGEVELRETVDPALIGGLAVRIGDRLYDGSVRSRLERLRARLTAV